MYTPKDENFNGRSDAAREIMKVHAGSAVDRLARVAVRKFEIETGRNPLHSPQTKRANARKRLAAALDMAPIEPALLHKRAAYRSVGLRDCTAYAIQQIHERGPALFDLSKGLPPQSANGTDGRPDGGPFPKQPVPATTAPIFTRPNTGAMGGGTGTHAQSIHDMSALPEDDDADGRKAALNAIKQAHAVPTDMWGKPK